MRIIAGKLKGTNLHLPQDKITRPLKDRARESIFNLLTHSNKMSFQFETSNILDLYAGTGSFGLECLSRQAESVCFVEKTKETKKKSGQQLGDTSGKTSVKCLGKSRETSRNIKKPYRNIVFFKYNPENTGYMEIKFLLQNTDRGI